MNKAQAQDAAKRLNSELASLNPSTVISLFEINLNELIDDRGFTTYENSRVFRFHNNTKLVQTSIWWKNVEYIAAPIHAEGFEFNGRGTLPSPKLSISTLDQGAPFLALLKNILRDLGDLSGARVTRRRTFAKYLDRKNFYANDQVIDSSSVPTDFYPSDNFASGDAPPEFPPDVYYIDRKSHESKLTIEFELASILDVEGVKLPGRLVIANRCPFTYRGSGCCYERTAFATTATFEGATLPDNAPAVANDKNERITELLPGTPIVIQGRYDSLRTYSKGNVVFITKDGVNYYFVAKVNNPAFPPPNRDYWIGDQCGKSVLSCKLRWGINGGVVVGGSGLVKGRLRIGAFPGVSRLAGNS